MAHPALLRTTSPTSWRSGWDTLERLLRRMIPRKPTGYRPELHYMRGGRTSGAKSLAAG